jgi:hypothetical protein
MTNVYHTVNEYEKVYFPNRIKSVSQQKQPIEPQKFGNDLATELLTILKKY